MYGFVLHNLIKACFVWIIICFFLLLFIFICDSTFTFATANDTNITNETDFTFYSNPLAGISLNAPANWQQFERTTSDGEATIGYYKHPSQFQGLIAITKENIPKNITIEQYIATMDSFLRELIPSYKINEVRLGEIKGNKAYDISFSTNLNDIPLKGNRITFNEGGIAYQVTFISPLSNYAENQQIAHKVIET